MLLTWTGGRLDRSRRRARHGWWRREKNQMRKFIKEDGRGQQILCDGWGNELAERLLAGKCTSMDGLAALIRLLGFSSCRKKKKFWRFLFIDGRVRRIDWTAGVRTAERTWIQRPVGPSRPIHFPFNWNKLWVEICHLLFVVFFFECLVETL